MSYKDDEYGIVGIYKILNKINNKVYIGSSKDIFERWKYHIRDLRNNKHHSKHLQNAWNKYGENNFLFCIIENCDNDELLEREQFYIDAYDSANSEKGYNICDKVVNCFASEKMLSKIRGESSHFNKYSEEEIKQLIEYLKTGDYKYSELAEMFDISYDVVASIASHSSWAYLTHDIVFPDSNKFKRDNVKLSESDVGEIVKMMLDNKTNNEISKIFGVKPKTISDIRNHKTWVEFTNGIDFIRSPRNSDLTDLQKKIKEYSISHPTEDYNDVAKNVGSSPAYANKIMGQLKRE